MPFLASAPGASGQQRLEKVSDQYLKTAGAVLTTININLDGWPSFHELRREKHIQMIVDVNPVRAQPLVTLGECAGLGVR
jgi:hypothetical protein